MYDHVGYADCAVWVCDYNYYLDRGTCDRDSSSCFSDCATQHSNCQHGQGYAQQGCEDNYEAGVGNCAEQNGQCTDLCYQLYP